MKKIKKTKKGYIVAQGEATGHAHRIKDNIELYKKTESEKYLKSTQDFIVTHEEHKEIKMPCDDYDISIVKEYDPYMQISRNVVD